MTARWCPEQGWTGTPDQADYERELRRLATPSYSATLRPYQEPPTRQIGATCACPYCLTNPMLQGHMCVRIEYPTGILTRIIR